MKVTESNVSVKDLIHRFNDLPAPNNATPSSVSRSPITRNVISAANSSDTLGSANNSSTEKKGDLQQSGLMQKLVNTPLAKNEFTGGVDILIETYRKCSLQPEDIKSLCRTCPDLNNYIINSEKLNLEKGRVSHNTLAAVAACEELIKPYVESPSFKFAGERCYFLLNSPKSNIPALYQVANLDNTARTIGMLADAGVLHKNLIMSDFGTMDERILKEEVIDDVKCYIPSRKGVENSVNEAFSTLKSDSFINELLRYGFSTKPEHKNCISILGNYIDFTKSYLPNRNFDGVDFSTFDLCGTNFNNCKFDNCNFSDENFKESTISGASFNDCNCNISSDYESVRGLIAEGVKGLNFSHNGNSVNDVKSADYSVYGSER